MSEALKTSVNLKGDLRRRLEWYCDVNDLQPAQAVKMFVIQGLKNMPSVRTWTLPRVRTKIEEFIFR